jgi:hypothetical protein
MVTCKYSRSISRILTVAVIASWMLSAQLASAFLGEVFGGAMQGAVLGSLLDGRDGAQTGAAIGAGIGVLSAVAENAERRDAEKAARARYEQQKAQRELRRQEAEEQRFEASSRAFSGGVPSNMASIGSLQPHEDEKLITEVQRSLLKLNYDPGTIDGQLNDKTVAAIQAYQARHNLLETGQPSQELLRHMIRNGG